MPNTINVTAVALYVSRLLFALAALTITSLRIY